MHTFQVKQVQWTFTRFSSKPVSKLNTLTLVDACVLTAFYWLSGFDFQKDWGLIVIFRIWSILNHLFVYHYLFIEWAATDLESETYIIILFTLLIYWVIKINILINCIIVSIATQISKYSKVYQCRQNYWLLMD